METTTKNLPARTRKLGICGCCGHPHAPPHTPLAAACASAAPALGAVGRLATAPRGGYCNFQSRRKAYLTCHAGPRRASPPGCPADRPRQAGEIEGNSNSRNRPGQFDRANSAIRIAPGVSVGLPCRRQPGRRPPRQFAPADFETGWDSEVETGRDSEVGTASAPKLQPGSPAAHQRHGQAHRQARRPTGGHPGRRAARVLPGRRATRGAPSAIDHSLR